jgi:aldehyde dehydrogenase (NAD+)
MLERNQIFINGKWVDSSGDGVISVVNPATEEAIATVPAGSSEDAGRGVEAAASALEGWSGTSLDERLNVITALADALSARSAEITDTIVREVGMPKKIAVAGQTGGAIEDLRVIAQVAREIVWDEQVGNATVSRVPAGVVGAITPWNVPLKMICLKAGAAMAAGCTVVLKGSEIAPLSSFIFAEAAAEAGVPDGVFNLVSGTGPVVGEAIAGHPLVDVVSLTGSVRAGQRIVELSAATIKKLALELGGKSAGHPRGHRRRLPQLRSGVRWCDSHSCPACPSGRGREPRGREGRELRAR